MSYAARITISQYVRKKTYTNPIGSISSVGKPMETEKKLGKTR